MKNKFYRKVLENGMTILFEKRGLPVVSVAIAVKNGGVNEAESEKGISHFIEHMLYKGTPSRDAKQIAEGIERNGGELNGFTDETLTAYFCKIPSKHLDIALEILSDMVKNPLFDEKELEKERKVIFEEIKMRKDNPRTYCFDEIQSYLYGSPFGKNLIGTKETLNKISREVILKKFKEIYTPNNMILCVVGDADFEKIVDFANKNFGDVKGKVPHFKIVQKNKKNIEKRKGVDQANLVFAYHVPLATEEKSFSAMVLNSLLAGGMSSRLFSEIREKRNLAYSISGASTIEKDFSYNLIYVGTTPENIEIVKDLILREFKKVFEDLEEKELEEVKEQLVGNYYISMEESMLQVHLLLREEVLGDARHFYNFEEKIRKVKLEDVKNLAKIKDYSFFALVPE